MKNFLLLCLLMLWMTSSVLAEEFELYKNTRDVVVSARMEREDLPGMRTKTDFQTSREIIVEARQEMFDNTGMMDMPAPVLFRPMYPQYPMYYQPPVRYVMASAHYATVYPFVWQPDVWQSEPEPVSEPIPTPRPKPTATPQPAPKTVQEKVIIEKVITVIVTPTPQANTSEPGTTKRQAQAHLAELASQTKQARQSALRWMTISIAFGIITGGMFVYILSHPKKEA